MKWAKVSIVQAMPRAGLLKNAVMNFSQILIGLSNGDYVGYQW